ncbi:MAG: hypothetical protein JSW73_00815 [Candidatus Woesearchaeota archaeon]|nr:MAG: hypothetical protein JSW73_00815 [Candidatus Woesearchaeota archaeon]
MVEGFDVLKGKRYGRSICLEQNGPYKAAFYRIQSEGNKARKIVSEEKDGNVYWKTISTNEEENEANPRYLLYNILEVRKNMLFLANGEHSSLIANTIDNSTIPSLNAMSILMNSYENKRENIVDGIKLYSYEDDRHGTPRISGAVMHKEMAFCSVLKGKDKRPHIMSSNHNLERGKGKIISTYSGEIKDPLPSFTSIPIEVKLEGSLEELVNNFHESSPIKYRVSTAGILWTEGEGVIKEAIVNENE